MIRFSVTCSTNLSSLICKTNEEMSKKLLILQPPETRGVFCPRVSSLTCYGSVN